MAGLWDVLVGAATGVGGELEKQQEQQRKLQQIRYEAQAKATYPDPITQLLMRQFGLTSGQPQDQAGSQGLGGMALNRLNVKGFSLSNPEAEARLAAEKALAVDRAKSEANIPSAIRDIATLRQQFDEAFPVVKGQQSIPAVQRAIGFSKTLGARLGIGITPQQAGLLKTLPLAGIGLVRLAGALGRVTNIELEGARQALEQQGLTPEERFETAKALSRQYIARIAPDDWRKITADNPDLPGILSEFGISPPQLGGTSVGQSAMNPYLTEARRRGLIK